MHDVDGLTTSASTVGRSPVCCRALHEAPEVLDLPAPHGGEERHALLRLARRDRRHRLAVGGVRLRRAPAGGQRVEELLEILCNPAAGSPGASVMGANRA